jgi:hypothetical protein
MFQRSMPLRTFTRENIVFISAPAMLLSVDRNRSKGGTSNGKQVSYVVLDAGSGDVQIDNYRMTEHQGVPHR